MKTLLFCFCLPWIAFSSFAEEVSVDREIVRLIFNRATAEAYFEKEFAPGSESMRQQGYSEQTLAGARKIIVSSVEGLFADPAFIDHFANLYSTHFSKEELKEIRDFYATKTGQKMFSFMLATWEEQGKFPDGLAKKHFAGMSSELENFFKENPPEQRKAEQDGAAKPAKPGG